MVLRSFNILHTYIFDSFNPAKNEEPEELLAAGQYGVLYFWCVNADVGRVQKIKNWSCPVHFGWMDGCKPLPHGLRPPWERGKLPRSLLSGKGLSPQLWPAAMEGISHFLGVRGDWCVAESENLARRAGVGAR